MLRNVSDATISFAAIWLLVGWVFGLLFAVSLFWRRITKPADGTVRLLRMQIDDDTARLKRQQDIIDELTGEVGQLYQKLDRMARRFAEVSAERVA